MFGDVMLKKAKKISEKTIERLSVYRRFLKSLQKKGQTRVYSHQLAKAVSGTAAQVRRDLMEVGCNGCSSKGYEIDALISEISELMDFSTCEKVALIGVGNLGRAVLGYFSGKNDSFEVVCSFDSDQSKTGRIICGRRCYAMENLNEIIKKHGVRTVILAVPSKAANEVAQRLVAAGVHAILNFAPTHLEINDKVYVENLDMTMSMEKAIFFSRQITKKKEGQQ
jgi:redox-sensing transcriptional repressor